MDAALPPELCSGQLLGRAQTAQLTAILYERNPEALSRLAASGVLPA
jgi:hypothetical protein